jgi:hypothetical protein
MGERIIRLGLYIETGSEADAEELAELAGQLGDQLLELDIERVDPVTDGQTPAGTRAGDVVVAGALMVSLIQSSGLLSAVVDMVRSWVCRIGRRSVRLEIDGDVLEVTGIGSQAQRELIQVWIDRHT